MMTAGLVLAFILMINALVLWNNLARLAMARALGVPVDVVSIGFIKELIGASDRRGTRWRLGWWPIGGYLKYADEDRLSAEAMKAEDARGKAVLARTAATMAAGLLEGPRTPPGILQRLLPFEKEDRVSDRTLVQILGIGVAGPIACLAIAAALFAGVFARSGVTVTPPLVDSLSDGPAAEAGLQPGDLILSVDGDRVATFNELRMAINASRGTEVALEVRRESGSYLFKVTPKDIVSTDSEGKEVRRRLIGIRSDPASGSAKRLGLFDTIELALGETIFALRRSGEVTVEELRVWIFGASRAEQLAGPIRTTTVSRSYPAVDAFLYYAAITAIALALGGSLLMLRDIAWYCVRRWLPRGRSIAS